MPAACGPMPAAPRQGSRPDMVEASSRSSHACRGERQPRPLPSACAQHWRPVREKFAGAAIARGLTGHRLAEQLFLLPPAETLGTTMVLLVRAHEPQPDPAPLPQKLPRSSVAVTGAAQSAAPPCCRGNAAPQLSATLHRPWLPLHKTSKKHQLEYRTSGHIDHHELVKCTGQDSFPELHKKQPFFCTCSPSLLKQRCASSYLLFWEHRDSPKQGCC